MIVPSLDLFDAGASLLSYFFPNILGPSRIAMCCGGCYCPNLEAHSNITKNTYSYCDSCWLQGEGEPGGVLHPHQQGQQDRLHVRQMLAQCQVSTSSVGIIYKKK